MPFKVGENAIIRTKEYLEAGKVYLSEKIKVFTINSVPYVERHKGINEFITWHLPQIQYKNPDVHCIVFKHKTPTPFIRCFLENGEDVVIDVDNQRKTDILNHVIKVLGKPPKILHEELLALEKKENPANFGYLCNNHCICQKPGQIPCPALVPVPTKLRGKYRRYTHKGEKKIFT